MNTDIQRVIAKFSFKEGQLDEFNKLLSDPENGLNFTRKCDGFIDIECLKDQDNPNTLVLLQKWNNKQNHLDYLKLRTDQGLFTKLETMLESKPEILYVQNI